MIRVFLLLVLVSVLANCARTPSTPSIKQNTAQPGGGTSPSPTPSPTSKFKWTEQELSENTNSCAEAGAGEYSYQSWKIFCRCTYEEAARRWTFDYFSDNFEASYDSLYNDGVIHQCLEKGGINVE